MYNAENKLPFLIEEYGGMCGENEFKYYMHCSTLEEAVMFTEYLDSIGRRFISGDRYTDDNKWHVYERNTVYNFMRGSYANIDLIDKTSIVLEMSDFILPSEEYFHNNDEEFNDRLDNFLS